jgi:soluble lytic murein transglycosylase-like protein
MSPVPARHRAVAGVSVAGLAAALYLAVPGEAAAPEPELACPAPVVEEARPAALAKVAAGTVADSRPLDASQRVLVKHLSRRFQVAREAVGTIVAEAYRAGDEVGLDPLLLLAVISVESSFNPVAESMMGAKGLMQIIPRFHLAKLEAHGGEEAVLDPVSNIRVGARILQEYVHRMGTLEGGLQFYNGARKDPTAQYAGRVMAERARLEQTMRQALRAQPLRAVEEGAGRNV